MTAIPVPSQDRQPVVVAGLGLTAAAAAVLALWLDLGVVLWALLGLVAGVLVVVALSRPAWALAMLVIVEASNASSVVGPIGGASLYLAVLGLASVSAVLGVATGRLALRWSPALLLAAVFVAAQAPSVLAASDRALAWTAMLELAKDLWFLVVVVVLALSAGSAWMLARLFVGTMTVLAGLAAVNQFVLGNAVAFGGFAVVSQSSGVGVATARHAGPFDDPNFYGRLLLLAWPLAVSLAVTAWRRRDATAAASWSGAVLLLLGGIYLTQSRGALLGLGVAVVMWLLLAGPRTRRLALLLPAAAVLLAALPGVGSRLATLSEVAENPSTVVDYSLVERGAAQQITLAIFADHALAGAGLANIPVVWDEYSNQADVVVEREVAPHNLYLEVAAEGGLLGLGGWLAFCAGVVVLAARVVTARPVRAPDQVDAERLLGVGGLAAVSAWGMASLFLHLSFFRPLLIVVAVLAVLERQTPRAARVARVRHRSARRRLGILAAGPAVAGMVAGIAFIGMSSQVWVARVPVAVLPQTASGGGAANAYEYDLVSRSTVMPTYAAVVQYTGRPRSSKVARLLDVGAYRAAVTVDPSSSFLLVEARGPDRDTATRIAEAIARRGAGEVNAEPSLSNLATTTVGRTTVEQVREWSFRGLALLACAVLVLVWLRGFVRRPRTRA